MSLGHAYLPVWIAMPVNTSGDIILYGAIRNGSYYTGARYDLFYDFRYHSDPWIGTRIVEYN